MADMKKVYDDLIIINLYLFALKMITEKGNFPYGVDKIKVLIV